jgi:hypothetical protein
VRPDLGERDWTVAASLMHKLNRTIALLAALAATAAAILLTGPAAATPTAGNAGPGTWIYTPEPVGPWEPLPVHRSKDKPEQANMTLTHSETRIPPSFFGLAIEYDELGDYEAEGSLFDRALSLMQPQDGAPMVLRVGGKSGDDMYWDTATNHAPPWVFELDDQWMAQLAALVRRDDLHVMLGLNMAVHSPQMAADFAKAARAALPRRSIVGLDVGNEPDLYYLQPALQKERVASTLPSTAPDWTHGYSPADYRRDYDEYARVLTAQVPGIPLAGPDTVSSVLDWVTALGGLGAESPELITTHRYPSSTCAPPLSNYYPSMRSFLGEGGSFGLAKTVIPTLTFARRHDMRVRINEINTVSCGGVPGVTNTFATALWTPDALFEMINTGASGVNWETRPDNGNAPFHPIAGGIDPLPELYGLATFAQMIGPRPRLVATKLVGPVDLHLKAWAVSSSNGLRILLINKGPRGVITTLHLGPTPSRAKVRWLWAAATNSVRGITLGGQGIGADARWHGRPRQTTTARRHGIFSLTVPGYSAALLTLPSS